MRERTLHSEERLDFAVNVGYLCFRNRANLTARAALVHAEREKIPDFGKREAEFLSSLVLNQGGKFIKVSVVVNNQEVAGLPDQRGQGLLLWGSGLYRKSDPYLAYLPLGAVKEGQTVRLAVQYFAGPKPDHTGQFGAPANRTRCHCSAIW
jgi:hypothetical protein